jgi:serine/threonine-protein kinase
MAEVWLATDLSLSRQVAVKLLKPALAADPIVAERFRREAVAVAQLSHPNIVAVYDAIEDNGRQAVVMQLINGKSLRQLLDEQKRLSPDLTMHIGMCVAAALDAAHAAHMVHRDVKPGNILITSDGKVLLTDFGIAKGLASDDDDLTSANIMMGTAKYLSPEQVRGRKLDGRADLYSLGLVLYECLAGRVPFLGETDADTALARLNRDPTDLATLRPTLPYGLAPLIHRLLKRKPDDRYASGSEVRAELSKVAAAASDTTSGMTPPQGAPSGNRTPPRGTSPRDSTARQPGSPQQVGGYQAVRTGRPAGAPVRADRTPPSTAAPRQHPNRSYQHRTGPSLAIVGGLLLIALIIGLVLLATLNDHGKGFVPPTTLAPATAAAAGGAPATSVGIVSVSTFDPDGDDPTENDNLVGAAIDGNPSTEWMTLCYSDRFMSGKEGVGLVADLGANATGTFTAVIASAPYQVKVFTAPDGPRPTSFASWGAPVQSFASTTVGDVSVQLTTPVRYVLVSFNELGSDSACKNPFRGRIAELTFAPG